MKKFLKMAFAVVAFAAVGLGSYKAYGRYMAANMSEEDLLIAENIEALADDGEGIKVLVRDRQETTDEITVSKTDDEGNYIGDSILGYSHVVRCLDSGVTPCTSGSDVHWFSDTDYKCTIGK